MRTEPTSVAVTVARDDEHVLVERLWQLYRHDLSEFRGMLPETDGLFKPGRLPAHLHDEGSVVYLVRVDGAPAGFVLVDSLQGEERTVSELFVARAVRRYGV